MRAVDRGWILRWRPCFLGMHPMPHSYAGALWLWMATVRQDIIESTSQGAQDYPLSP